MEPYDFPRHAAFANREADLRAITRWWESPTRDALCLVGRRRVGKSWLFREFAHGKPAIVLVADGLLPATQMGRFADSLEGPLEVRPDVSDLPSLLRAIYRLGRTQPVLVVLDEVPYLLPDGQSRQALLTQLQAVMEEERDQSQTKLMLCGSLLGQMTSLLAEDSPLHGRLQRLDVWPLTFSESRVFMPPHLSPTERITRYAVAGGMARYLAEFQTASSLATAVCEIVLDRRGPLFDDVRTVLQQELRQPATYFSLLQALARGAAPLERLSDELKTPSTNLTFYLETLNAMRLVESKLPAGAKATSHSHSYILTDGFLRFWFRFVLPNQENLQAGLSPIDLWNSTIEPSLADHVSPTFEDLCRRWVRAKLGAIAPSVGSWWGNALDSERRAKRRSTEEIDVVGHRYKRVAIVGECKWTNQPMPMSVLNDLRRFKIPALAQDGQLTVAQKGPRIILFSRSGFDHALTQEAATNSTVQLVDVDELVRDLESARD